MQNAKEEEQVRKCRLDINKVDGKKREHQIHKFACRMHRKSKWGNPDLGNQ
jgi:hypothetical protein